MWVVYNMEVLKHFVEKCVGSIRFEVSRHFGVLVHFWLKNHPWKLKNLLESY